VEVATSILSRREQFERVGSTNDIVRGWLAEGTPEVCVAIAGEQTAGRGRNGRTWTAPPGAGLLLSLGFRPSWLAPDRVWQLAATASLAMAEGAEDLAGLPDRSIRLKWPNDLVVADGPVVRKLGGVLGETDGLGSDDPRAVVGMGINVDWRPADFPTDLAPAMTSLRALTGDHPVDGAALADAFLARLETRIDTLRHGRFDAVEWADRQVTTGREIDLVRPDETVERVIARRVDPATGALIVAGGDSPDVDRSVVVGEIRHIRLAGV
jgi:BirA family transcriptional regulator, biotin operon repressor / biotin---[acetyl-CoA-carboxylase] ligase